MHICVKCIKCRRTLQGYVCYDDPTKINPVTGDIETLDCVAVRTVRGDDCSNFEAGRYNEH